MSAAHDSESQQTTQHSRNDDSQPTSRDQTPDVEIESQTTVEDEPNDGNGEWEDADEWEEDDDSFPYTVAEIATIFTEFYQFLGTLHFDPANLKFPPPEGWPELAPGIVGTWKEEFALDVLRHLPYFDHSTMVPVEFKSRLVDYRTMGPDFFAEPDSWEENMDYDRGETSQYQPRMLFTIAEGHESCGQQWIFDAQHGEVWVENLRCDTQGPFDVKDFFAGFVDKYRKLDLISFPMRITMEADDVPDPAQRISEEEVLAQVGEDWETDLDKQYIKQVLREYGWPDAFRREECRAYIDDLMNRMEKVRGEGCVWDDDGFSYE